MTRLLQPKNIMCSVPLSKGKYISLMNVIQGDVDPLEVHKSLQRVKERHFTSAFIPWAPAGLQVVLANSSPFVKTDHRVSGLMLANHTSMHLLPTYVSQLLSDCVKRFDKLFKAGAFVENYRNYGNIFKDNLEEFNDSREVVNTLIEEYKSCQKADYLDHGQTRSLMNLT